MLNFILASGSPRRIKLLKQIGINPQIMPVDCQEFKTASSVENLVKKNALLKAKTAFEQSTINSGIILAADTVVAKNKQIWGKPENKKEAAEMLNKLSNSSHKVYTGMALLDFNKNHNLFDQQVVAVETKVYFSKLTPKEIQDYIATGEPMDKAGAYGIQEQGAVFVEKIEGDYFNIVGLPLAKLKDLLNNRNYSIWQFK